jgi:hypothetical protein
MGNYVSAALGPTPAASIIEQPPLQVSGQISKRTYSCSSNDFPVSTRQPRNTSKSFAVDPQKYSFVNIAPELRNRIYAELFIVESPVILAPQKRTTVPGLLLLQICKQIHDEVASLSYAMNLFQCFVLKVIPVPCISEGRIQCPKLNFFISPTTFLDSLAIRGDICFPAQRYHQYLTRLSIGVKASFHVFHMTTLGR